MLVSIVRLKRLRWMFALILAAFVALPVEGRCVVEINDTAQLSGKVVQVSRVYAPTIGDAEKISTLPSLLDTLEGQIYPMRYIFLQRDVHTDFPVRPVPPAKLGQESLGTLRNWYVKVGYGNYISPLLESYYSSDGVEAVTYDVSLKHLSAWGRVKLYDGVRVSAPHSSSSLAGTVRAVAGSVGLSGGAQYRHVYDNFYGADTLRSAVYNPLWQSGTNAHLVDAAFRIESLSVDSSRFRYAASLSYGGYYDSRRERQSRYSVAFKGQKYWRHTCFGGDLNFDYFDKAMNPPIGDNVVVGAMPWVRIGGDRWRVQVGVQFVYDYNNGKGYPYFFPRAHLSYDVVEGYFVPYLEVQSGLEMADYRTIRGENPWISPGLRVRNAAKRLDIVAGVKGKFNNRLSYNLRGSYAIYDSAHFYVNREIEVVDAMSGIYVWRAIKSDFGVLYDNADVLHLNGSLDYRLGQYLLLGIQGDYWHWSARHIDVPWHKPKFRVKAHASYNLRRKLQVGLDFNCTGGCKAKGLDGVSVALPVEYGLDLHAQYRFVSDWSFFIDLRNVLAHRYEIFYRYPAQRFNGHMGVILDF